MRLYIRKIDKQCIDKQISYTKYILSEFLDNKDDQDSIICEGKNSHYIEKVKILLATDPRFDNNIKSVLSHEGKLEVGDIMVMYKKKSKYLVELVKNTDTKYASLILLFDENDRHLLINVDDNDIVNIDYYAKFKKLMEWFVKQLNINNNLEQGERKSGQGYKEGAAIRNQYSDWRDYGTFTLDCNLVGGFQGVQSSVNYINKTGTGIDIRPQFNKNTKEIVYFEIDLYNEFILADNEIKNILNKKYYLSNLNLFDELEPNMCIKELFDDYTKIISFSQNQRNIESQTRIHTGENIILYGVPGSGKSYTIKKEYCEDGVEYERVVFHPDYTYSDFVGQVLPRIDETNGDVKYEFVPGPFTRILKNAYINPTTKYILIIEEINRGNAPAIFGDIFQLLDRDIETRESEYSITNTDIAKVVYHDENCKIKIPSNLSIIGTMNTSDQNVFVLDNAFQRRWKMRLIENKFSDNDVDNKLAKTEILDTNVTWKKFCETINEFILDKNQGMSSSEDKRLGTHFVGEQDLILFNIDNNGVKQETTNKRDFPEKVIKYLWDDAFKLSRDEIFSDENKSLEMVIQKFVAESNEGRFNIFKENVRDALINQDRENN